MSCLRCPGFWVIVSTLWGTACAQVVEQQDMIDAPNQFFVDRFEKLLEVADERTQGRVIRVRYSYWGYRRISGSQGFSTTVRKWSSEADWERGRSGLRDTLPELERIEEEGDANEVVFEYRMIDYARDLLAGRYSDQLAEVADTIEERSGVRLPSLTRQEIVEEAVGAYGMHLSKYPEDWFAMREMAVALLELGRVGDAVDLMYVAYFQEPEMGIFPISSVLFGEFSRKAMKKLVIRAVQDANRKSTAEGWLLVAVLMQAQGRVELAGEMLDRADEFGLEAKILGGLREAMP